MVVRGQPWNPRRPLLREWSPGQPDHLHSPHDSSGILAVDSFVGRRVGCGELSQESRKRYLPELSPQHGVSGGRLAQTLKQGFEVKPCATTKNRQPSSILNICNRRTARFDEASGIEPGREIQDIQQVMWHAGTLRQGWFGRPNVQAAIHLH